MNRFGPRLTKADKTEIVAMLQDGVPRAEIAEAFGITVSAVTYHALRAGLSGPTRERDDTLPVLPGHAFAYPPWMDQGLCASADPEAWFPDKGGSTREAKAICRRCTVAAECLDYALTNQERFGIWGGLSERQRRRLTHHLDTTQENTA